MPTFRFGLSVSSSIACKRALAAGACFVLAAIALIFNSVSVAAANKIFDHPVLRWPDTISLCLLPLQSSEAPSSDPEIIRAGVVHLLKGEGDFDYRFLLPTASEGEEIQRKGFVVIDKGPFRGEQAATDYWRTQDVQYVGVGTFGTRGDAFQVEFRLYGCLTKEPFVPMQLLGKRYTFSAGQLPELCRKIAADILTALREMGHRARSVDDSK